MPAGVPLYQKLIDVDFSINPKNPNIPRKTLIQVLKTKLIQYQSTSVFLNRFKSKTKSIERLNCFTLEPNPTQCKNRKQYSMKN
jgi:hypothetical protein